MSELLLRNRQRVRPVRRARLKTILIFALREIFPVEQYELAIHIVATREMTRLNESFLHHAGSTDVITFDYSEKPSRRNSRDRVIHGEIFVCMDDAISQARKFRTTWQSEIVRYAVHGILHLLGYDDTKPAARRDMKREENRVLRQLAAQFSFSKLSR